MSKSLPVHEFLAAPGIVLDVRSPGEYEQGHIPNAVSLPLFSNDERAQVGICYKQQGREQAVELGLELTGPKLAAFVRQAKDIAPDRTVRVHCWRGGMRSGSMAWLLETAGFSVTTLIGGYKAFRRWVRETVAVPKPIITLGGMTGSGKTAILHALAAQGEQVLDLEAIAHHRGSSYGSLGLPPQPSNEQFENFVATVWHTFDGDRPIWIEAESRRIGACRVPDELFRPMMAAPVLQVERPQRERIARLLNDYGDADRRELIAATRRIQKKLGGQHAKRAIACILEGNLAPAIEIVLNYYDKTYTYDLYQKRNVPIYSVNVSGLDAAQSAQLLIEKARFYLNDDE
jgi:tRNA 2-selenouridine synthase